MAIATQERLRHTIGRRVRQLRQDRRWTQTALANLLGLSQNRLSEIEHGKGSFTAEQLVAILRTFNVSLDHFVTPKDAISELQNALARLGAAHLAESTDVLPTDRLREAFVAVRETLASAESPRLIAALAPVLVSNIDGLNFVKLYVDVQSVGLTNRLGWVVENTVKAIALELADGKLSPRWSVRYRRAGVLLRDFVSHTISGRPRGIRAEKEDILDAGITTEEALKEAKKERSELSRRWHIVSAIRPEDFRRALEAGRGSD